MIISVCVTIATGVTVTGYPQYDDSIGWHCNGAAGLCPTSTGGYVIVLYL